ncbi:MAG TPA: glycosyltransferase family 1 protein [Chloroflexota bacterium]|nr:glycosyltransferase family 1 protein [Chloroflexota bacterium]
MPRVGLDGRDLLRKRTGVVNNTVNLARELSASHGTEVIVYTDRANAADEAPPRGVLLREVNAPPLLWKHVALPVALARDHVGVFHSPTGTLPLITGCKQVVTIHDLFAAIEPRWFSRRVGWQLRATQSRAARVAARVIAVSACTRADLVERYGVPPERIRVVYNGVDHARFRLAEVDAEAVARSYGVPHPFVLCVGSLMPWRNAPRLLRAVARIGYGLLFVGRDIWGTDPTARLAAQHGWEWARFSGYVPDDQLPTLYAAARVFAYPSLYEGFGIPPLEAMACGTPVVASTAGALPEVLGDAALLVDPYDEEALTEAIRTAAQDKGDLRRRGLERAARFTWQRAAEETWRVYEEAARLA